MLRKSLRVIGWIAAGLVTLCVVAYLAALAINWHDQPPNATAIRLAQMFRDRPAIADEDNAYAYLRQHKFDRDRRKLWAVAQTLEAPFTHYEAGLRRADELNERTTDEAATFRIYNRVGVAGLANLSSFSTYAARVSDIEGTRRAVLLAATLRASGTASEHLPTTVASAELRSPYTDRPFDWDEPRGAIVFRGLETGERGEHVIYY